MDNIYIKQGDREIWNLPHKRLAALRANAKAKGIVARQPTNPAVIGQRVIAKFYKECNGWINHGCGLQRLYSNNPWNCSKNRRYADMGDRQQYKL